MRRKDREITDAKQIEEILKEGKVCYLALCKENEPYVVPMHYAWQSGYLYLHSAREGKKVEFAKQNPQVSFCIVPQWEIIEGSRSCDWTTHYRSVMGSGVVEFVEDVAEKTKALETFMGHYTSERFEFSKAMLDRVLVWKIKVDELTGKKNP
ncbi:MAG: pyridoxamine 5'-phosphate oxidase family protein [Acetomicrobium sp.]|uniref:pyridoxamine 5'-phosphate oxidase family protein n=1 Tax=Acetomicrobium sp. TaxID=1872099 RepID=UPI0016B247F3|nr:pyridoxamine 5'-phosphate oxidase family protein [Acetomicrobium sp.]MDI9378059.1 pyridoxamine 5'-phosphate oxidase family protein [Synergistota bacterium]MDR9769119.1 pyridoxamine 5'-phosphate oxidase family protein [Acetomicrobium sp.]NLI42274.1 pyridoxamine 5'-phosphate oxidase family protein [Synergistaceae bacterium]HOM96817.1 pyridoxamine 5'-phosphate oxidase family protein [Acetomicrobium sp.]